MGPFLKYIYLTATCYIHAWIEFKLASTIHLICNMPLLQDKVENVARMSASHEELLSDLGKYKKISEWKKDAEKVLLL